MFNIQRKDMPLKGWITTYETKINDPKMDKEIKKIIDKQGDRQDHKKKCKSTDDRMEYERSTRV